MQKLHEADRDFKFSESLPNSLFQKNREKFLTLFKSRVQSEQSKFAFFKGTDPLPMYNSDCEFYSYQEGFFFYLFGVVEESCYAALDLDNGKVTLFVP
jgi:Xaa-Pro dipeptidase